VAEDSDSSVAAPLAQGAYKSLGYVLCSAAETNAQDYCSKNDSEGVLDAQAFSSAAAAHAYLVSQQGQNWAMGWQLNQWAILIASSGPGMSSSDQDKIQKSLTSAGVIYNGQPLDGGGIASLAQVF
jgi:hypothetical protein